MEMHDRSSDESDAAESRRFRYGGHEITIHDTDPESAPMVRVDGTDIMIRREEGGGFSAPMLNMHAVYDSLEELARSLIDLSPVFLAQRRGPTTENRGEYDASTS
jgi:hypothetical protein